MAHSAYETFVVIQRAEALFAHRRARLYPAQADRYGADIRGRLQLAEAVGLDDVLEAEESRRRLRAAFAELFRRVDLLLTPVAATAPVSVGEEELFHRGVRRSFRDLVLPYTTPQNLVGLPACAFRAGFDELGLPVGLQLTGPRWREETVLAAVTAFVGATAPLQRRLPELVKPAGCSVAC